MTSTATEDFKTYNYQNLKVSFQDRHNGGGVKWAPEFVEHAKALSLQPKRILEYCCGPGFIGLSLLEAGFGEELYLVDINPAVEQDIQDTLSNNPHLAGKVTFLLSSRLSEIQEAGKFDLIVANPPHVDVLDPNSPRVDFNDPPILYSDPAWQIHKHLFADAPDLLSTEGQLLLIENGTYSSINDFTAMASQFNLAELSASREDFYFILGTPTH